MITFRREPVVFVFNKDIWWRIGGRASWPHCSRPCFLRSLNYLAFVVGHDTQPEAGRKSGETPH